MQIFIEIVLYNYIYIYNNYKQTNANRDGFTQNYFFHIKYFLIRKHNDNNIRIKDAQ